MNSSIIQRTGAHLHGLYRLCGRAVAAVFGWTVEGEFPNVRKAVFVASPHTSNWDGFFMLMASWHLGVRLSWITKHTMFRWPMGWFVRWLGGVPVDRRSRHDTVQQIAQQFADADSLYLAIAPAGTRSRTPNWKSGFYHIAVAANVPLILGYVDYGRKAAGVGPVIYLTGDVSADMDRIRTFYDGIKGRHPALHTPVRLRQEASADPSQQQEAAG